MPYPSRSEFTSDEPHSAWWIARVGQDAVLCSSTGAAFLRTLQRALQVCVSGAWDNETLQVLAQQIVELGGSPDLASTIDSQAMAGRVSHSAILGGVWLLHRAARGPLPGQLPLSDVRVPHTAVLPRYGNVIESRGQIGIACESLVDEKGNFVPWPKPEPNWLLGGLAVIALAVAYSWRA